MGGGEREMNRKPNLLLFIILATGLLLTIAIKPSFAQPPESDDPIIISLNDWTSQIVLSRILGTIYQQMGYEVRFEETDFRNQWGHMHRGNVHVQVEVWKGSMGQDFERMKQNGRVIDAGSHQAVTSEGWWYPTYVAEICPGLPDWRALNKCADIFVTPETIPKGRFLAGYWDDHEEARIRALNLNFTAEIANSTGELFSALKKALEEKKPILLLNWDPNWVQDRYEGSFVEFPKYDPKCISEPSWGFSKKWTYDCGQPLGGPLKKAAWSGIAEKWPCAWKVLQRMNLTNGMISRVAAMVDVDGIPHIQTAIRWMEDNKSEWQNWIPKECKSTTTMLD